MLFLLDWKSLMFRMYMHVRTDHVIQRLSCFQRLWWWNLSELLEQTRHHSLGRPALDEKDVHMATMFAVIQVIEIQGLCRKMLSAPVWSLPRNVTQFQ